MSDKTKKYIFIIGGVLVGFMGYNYFGTWKPDFLSKSSDTTSKADTKK